MINVLRRQNATKYKELFTYEMNLSNINSNNKINLPIEKQKAIIAKEKIKSLSGSVESDFAKDRISIEVQFGKYAFVQYDIYVKFTPQYNDNIIDLGVEIVPMKSLEKEMSSGPTNYERNLHEIFRQGRTFPPIPIILIGIDA